jgi:YegS/Rv2252/BmrU family lipid kinase
MSRKIIYLVNPVSGTAEKSSLKKLIETKTRRHQTDFQIRETSADGNYSSLKEEIENGRITDVVICGGDGTINKVIDKLRITRVNFGIIPMGSGNGLSLAAGIPLNPSRAIDLILNTGKPSVVDAFLVNGKFSCMLSGLGFDAMVAHDFAGRKARGFLTYLKRTIFHFFRCAPYPFEIICEGKPINTEAFFISIANSNQFGNRVTIAPRASLNDGLLDIVVVNKMNKFSMVIKLLWQIRSGKIRPANHTSGNQGVYYFNAKDLKIINPALAPLHIDGDPEETSETIDIEIIPEAFSLIRP